MQIHENFSLKPLNTFAIAAKARFFASFSSVEELQNLLNTKYFIDGNQPIILGGGSNILFTKDVDGFVLKNDLRGISVVAEDDVFYYVKAAAGEVWHQLVEYCLQHNYAGLENLSLIPGNVGASPMQNIGAYGVEIKDVFHELEALHVKEHYLRTFTLTECAFGYRESIFKKTLKNQFIILNVTFKLRKAPVFNTSYGAIEQELNKMGVTTLSIQHIAQAVIQIRQSKLPDPKVMGNAGSFFKNPTISAASFVSLQQLWPTIPFYEVPHQLYKIPAAWLIEQCGFKGYRKGDAGCNPLQPLVLVNYGAASGAEMIALSQMIIDAVQNRFGIVLEREVNIL
jgi:UDP-N-acetylmuramate dehydrogenase